MIPPLKLRQKSSNVFLPAIGTSCIPLSKVDLQMLTGFLRVLSVLSSVLFLIPRNNAGTLQEEESSLLQSLPFQNQK
jgi:hypothetical protein